jgi:hypothetical protein
LRKYQNLKRDVSSLESWVKPRSKNSINKLPEPERLLAKKFLALAPKLFEGYYLFNFCNALNICWDNVVAGDYREDNLKSHFLVCREHRFGVRCKQIILDLMEERGSSEERAQVKDCIYSYLGMCDRTKEEVNEVLKRMHVYLIKQLLTKRPESAPWLEFGPADAVHCGPDEIRMDPMDPCTTNLNYVDGLLKKVFLEKNKPKWLKFLAEAENETV